ncbi:MAG: PIN domain-containing protein [Verrucomicrobia bacterium]|nr:PIN domain-containing protein [Kiritimatiellia bacterium]MCP5487321.1 PIN domain-containing protein [Verrucomicrobiota bacterium]
MSADCFVDTNILVYSRDLGAGEKQVRASELVLELWNNRRGRVSIQVLNEYYVTVTRKLHPGLSSEHAWEDVSLLCAWNPVPMEWSLLERGRRLHCEYALSWWDALILAAAQVSNCGILYSEDLTHEEVYGGVMVINPFHQGL